MSPAPLPAPPHLYLPKPCPVCGGHAFRRLDPGQGAAPDAVPALECCRHCRLVRLVRPLAAFEPVTPTAVAPAEGQVRWTGEGLAVTGPGAAPFAHLACHDVIGRAPDPAVVVAALAGLLAPGGLIQVTEPDFHHWRRPAKLAAWAGFAPGERSHWFAARTLTRLLANHGLWLVHRRRRLCPVIDLVARKG
jgi:hypothetical protein